MHLTLADLMADYSLKSESIGYLKMEKNGISNTKKKKKSLSNSSN